MLVALVSLAAAAWSATGAGAASSAVVVAADVPSAISLTNDCLDPIGFRFGMVQPTQRATTSAATATACAFDFSSSNDSAMLRIGQRDGAGAAMGSASSTWTGSSQSSQMFTAVKLYDDSLGFAVGTAGLIARTTDTGASWGSQVQPAPGSGSMRLEDVAYVPGDSTTWWAVGADRTIVKVTSATTTPAYASGAGDIATKTWPSNLDMRSLVVLSASNIVIVGESGWVATTTNGGTNWSTYQLGTASFDDVAALGSTLYGVGSSGTFATTTLGAAAASTDWTTGVLGPGSRHRTIAIGDASNMYVAGDGAPYACRTAPCTSLANWVSMSGPRVRMPQSVESIDANASAPGTAFLVGAQGQMLKTTDTGVNWALVPTQTGTPLLDVAIVPSGTRAAAVGHDRVTLRTLDMTSWARTFSTSDGYWSAATSPVNGKVGMVGGDGGTIKYTTDGGATFSAATSPTTRPLFGAAYANDTVAWAVGEQGTIVKSTDGGATWTAQVSPVTNRRLWDVEALDTKRAWIVGEAGTLLATNDGGATWNNVSFPATTSTLRGISIAEGRIVLAGTNDFMRWSGDSGATWTTPTTLPAMRSFLDVSMVDAQYGYSTSPFNELYRTTDGGVTWTVAGYHGLDPQDLVAVSRDTIFIAAGVSNIGVSRDGGATWTYDDSIPGEVGAIAAIDANRVFIGGTRATIQMTAPQVSATSLVSDYGTSPANWAGTGSSSMFGVCLRDATPGTTVNTGPWIEDADGTCTATDSDPWRSIPTTPLKVGSVAAGVTGRLEFVWGIRTAQNQAPGEYSASIVIEAIAPAI